MFCVTALPPSTLILKIASAHTRLKLICIENGMKKWAKKRAIPNSLHFGIASVYVSSCIAVSLENVSLESLSASPSDSLRDGSQGIG